MEKRIAAAARVHDGAPAPPPDDERTHRSAAIPQAAPVRPSKAMAIRRPDAPGAERAGCRRRTRHRSRRSHASSHASRD